MNTPPPPPTPPARPPGPPKPPALRPNSAARAAAIFDAALDLPEAARAGLLAAECGGDEALMQRVQALLSAHTAAPDFLEAPPLTPEIEEQLARLKPEEEGERIGRYKLLQEIGEGGFGTVWMAEQLEPVSRKVALKIIKMGMDTREVIARFESERQALAMMDHPNIAKVFDAGATQYGRPFFVMELVKGIPITQYCDEAGLGTRERLALFGDVCAAINHAHQKGIIHRDIKPSNVMVTLYADLPVVKVIDFGIAKATQGKLTDKTLFTRFEQFIGTPVYMSPEQAALSAVDIDTRSDIYALGILLYELLIGKPPFDAKSLASAGYDEMRRIIREVEPPKPSSRLSTFVGEERTQLAKLRHIEPEKVGKLVEPDLDWIVMKAIEKDRTRRYETANAFAQDIRRFLADEPVSARPPSAGYQLQKYARRHKAALRVAAGIAAVLVAATVVSLWLAVRAIDAEQKTAATLKEVAAERDAKEVARKDAEAIAKFLGEVFQSPDPKRDGRTITVVETLDRAAKKLETDLANQPARQAKLQATLGKTYHALGLPKQAIPLLEKVRDYDLNTSGPEHPDTLSAMINLEESYIDAGRVEEGLKLRAEVLAIRRKTLGPEHPDTIQALVTLAFRSFYFGGRRAEAVLMLEEHRHALSAVTQLGFFYHDSHPRETEKAITAWSEAVDRDPNRTQIQYLLGKLLSSCERNAEAVQPLQVARNGYPGGERGVEIRLLLVKTLTALGREAEAEPIRQELASLKAAAAGSAGKVAILLSEGRTTEALPLLVETSIGNPEDTRLAMKVAALQAWFRQDADHAATSQRMLTWAAVGTSPESANRAAKLACIRPEADALRRKAALALARNGLELGKGMPAAPWFQLAAGMAEYRSGNHSAADAALVAAAQTASSVPAGAPPRIEGTANFYRAMSLFHQGKPAEARALFAATEAKMKPLPADDQNPLAGGADHDDLILWLACKEAKALLAEAGAPGK